MKRIKTSEKLPVTSEEFWKEMEKEDAAGNIGIPVRSDTKKLKPPNPSIMKRETEVREEKEFGSETMPEAMRVLINHAKECQEKYGISGDAVIEMAEIVLKQNARSLGCGLRWVSTSERWPGKRVICRWNHAGNEGYPRIDILDKQQIEHALRWNYDIEWLDETSTPMHHGGEEEIARLKKIIANYKEKFAIPLKEDKEECVTNEEHDVVDGRLIQVQMELGNLYIENKKLQSEIAQLKAHQPKPESAVIQVESSESTDNREWPGEDREFFENMDGRKPPTEDGFYLGSTDDGMSFNVLQVFKGEWQTTGVTNWLRKQIK